MKQNTVLCLCAHSDDQIFGPGGTLIKYASEGKKIITIVFSYGELSHPHLKAEVIIKKRVKESQAADKVIGGSGVIFLGLKEKHFLDEDRKDVWVNRITNLIEKYNPSIIFTHASDDPHADHRMTCRLVKEAYELSSARCPIYTFDVWTPFSLKKRDAPRLVVDIGSTFSKKLKALRCFESQLGFWGFLILNRYVWMGTIARNFFAGLRYGHKFSEVFYKLR